MKTHMRFCAKDDSVLALSRSCKATKPHTWERTWTTWMLRDRFFLHTTRHRRRQPPTQPIHSSQLMLPLCVRTLRPSTLLPRHTTHNKDIRIRLHIFPSLFTAETFGRRQQRCRRRRRHKDADPLCSHSRIVNILKALLCCCLVQKLSFARECEWKKEERTNRTLDAWLESHEDEVGENAPEGAIYSIRLYIFMATATAKCSLWPVFPSSTKWVNVVVQSLRIVRVRVSGVELVFRIRVCVLC